MRPQGGQCVRMAGAGVIGAVLTIEQVGVDPAARAVYRLDPLRKNSAARAFKILNSRLRLCSALMSSSIA